MLVHPGYLMSPWIVAAVARGVGAVLYATKMIFLCFPVKIVNREKIPYLESSVLLTDKIMPSYRFIIQYR